MEYTIEGKTEVVFITEWDQRFLGEDVLATHDLPLFQQVAF